MEFEFTFHIYEGEVWLAAFECVAEIEGNTGSGIHDDWTVAAIRVEGVPKSGEWEQVTLSDTSLLWEPMMLHLLNDRRHDIDDEWATHIVEARIGNRADEQRDNVISFGLHS